MRYPAGTCTQCPAQTEHIPGGYIHSDTREVHSEVNGYHAAAPSFDNPRRAYRDPRPKLAQSGRTPSGARTLWVNASHNTATARELVKRITGHDLDALTVIHANSTGTRYQLPTRKAL